MRSILRSLTFGLAVAAAGALSAQFPYTLVVQGTIAGCVPFQQVNIASAPGAQPSYNYNLEVFPNDCFYDTILHFNSASVGITVTTQCNGMVVTAVDSATFNFIGDTAVMTINLTCGGGGTLDCTGMLNGPNMPGTACNDGNPNTINDTWDANCICIGTAQTNCQASFTYSNSSPWVIDMWNYSTGQGSMLYDWQVSNGANTGQNSPFFVFSSPGAYSVCLTIYASNQCTSTMCDTVYVDSVGNVSSTPFYYDCLGALNGPNTPGTACDDGDPMTILDVWSANCVCVGQDTNTYDCLGLLNGPNMPGTPCDDNDVNTVDDVWSAWCACFGDTLAFDCTGLLNGPNMPGTACDDGDPNTINDLWSPTCVCSGSDTTAVYDCLFIPNGPNLPGTPCTTFFGTPGVWNMDCICVGDTNNNVIDCLGLLNGPNMPGTACDDNDPSTTVSWWSLDCVCTSDTGGTLYDCLQIPNGPNLPGTPCVIPGTNIEGTWSNACVCIPDSTDPCQADFWVLQAYGQDSLPVPYELWVWNLSSGGSGVYSYLWDFGDGTTSTDPYPTHTYDGNGPYVLCLTLNDLNGCTSVHCDSISIDGDGMYNGMTGGEGNRQDGFTINVQNPAGANGMEELSVSDVVLWPNPVVDELNVAINSAVRGAATFTVFDLNGRVVMNERHALNGRTQLRLATEALEPGLYTLRINDGTRNLTSLRFVRTN